MPCYCTVIWNSSVLLRTTVLRLLCCFQWIWIHGRVKLIHMTWALLLLSSLLGLVMVLWMLLPPPPPWTLRHRQMAATEHSSGIAMGLLLSVVSVRMSLMALLLMKVYSHALLLLSLMWLLLPCVQTVFLSNVVSSICHLLGDDIDLGEYCTMLALNTTYSIHVDANIDLCISNHLLQVRLIFLCQDNNAPST